MLLNSALVLSSLASLAIAQEAAHPTLTPAPQRTQEKRSLTNEVDKRGLIGGIFCFVDVLGFVSLPTLNATSVSPPFEIALAHPFIRLFIV
jgi:hypothetical protein